MLLITQLTINCIDLRDKTISQELDLLCHKASLILKCPKNDILDLQIIKRSIDARKKPVISYTYSLAVNIRNEKAILKKLHNPTNVSIYEPQSFFINVSRKSFKNPPVVCGFGPAGIAAAYTLALKGYDPIIIERGSSLEKRCKDVNEFWKSGILSPDSNVQFGEGGAGAFSDGKLNTGNKDKDGIQRKILEILVEHGAKPSILYEAKPHIGTDMLLLIVKNIRQHIKDMGGTFMFNTALTGINIENHSLVSIDTTNGEIITDTLILAIGHSARDTFRMLQSKKVALEPKPFAVGYRVIHPQEMINTSQYGESFSELGLPPADYKLTYKTSSGRSVYSFCMCPGGYVVNAQSQPNRLCVNGMSYSKRDGAYANSAIVMAISPDEIPGFLNVKPDPLMGIDFQEHIESLAYDVGGGHIAICTYKDFIDKSCTHTDISSIASTAFKGNVSYTGAFTGNNQILPKVLDTEFIEAMEAFGHKIKGFSHTDTLVSAIESRTSSPVRIPRNPETFVSNNIKGLYPCGEGSGYAGGIMSAATDGIRVVNKILTS